jgi:hypothetical protein
MRRVVLGLSLLGIVVAGAAPAAGAERVGGVRLLKIQFDPPGADNGSNTSLNAEYVVIVNRGSHQVTLTGWTLRDRSAHVFRFPTFTLGAGAKVTIHTGTGSDNAHNLYWASDGYIWNNDGDTATLRRPSGVLVDRCSYSGSDSTASC